MGQEGKMCLSARGDSVNNCVASVRSAGLCARVCLCVCLTNVDKVKDSNWKQ